MLYIVATPIGNLEDITLRAVRILSEVDVVACEDTRQTRKLLDHLEISPRLMSFHAHSMQRDLNAILGLLEEGKTIALVSDAGTPGISDPGFLLTTACVRKGISVVPIPGAAAFLTALQGSGVPVQEFTYYGFPPAKKGRQTFFRHLAEVERTQVFYESKHRLLKALSQLAETVPERTVVVAKELTKSFEQFHHGTPAELLEVFQDEQLQKGEFVIIVAATGFTFTGDVVVRSKQQHRRRRVDK